MFEVKQGVLGQTHPQTVPKDRLVGFRNFPIAEEDPDQEGEGEGLEHLNC